MKYSSITCSFVIVGQRGLCIKLILGSVDLAEAVLEDQKLGNKMVYCNCLSIQTWFWDLEETVIHQLSSGIRATSTST